jgi:hypothetical protein
MKGPMRISTLTIALIGATIALLPAGAIPETYTYSHYNSTPGCMGWTYWDSLGQQMVWDTTNLRWTCRIVTRGTPN